MLYERDTSDNEEYVKRQHL